MTIFEKALTFDDVLLVPAYSNILPKSVNLESHITSSMRLKIPLLSAAMDTVTEHKLAIALAQEGGIGIIHKNLSIKDQALEVSKVKKHESGIIRNPITITTEQTIGDALRLSKLNGISAMPVVDGKKLIGIVTGRDMRFATQLSDSIETVMTSQPNLITIQEKAVQRDTVVGLLHKHRIERLLVVNEAHELQGMITVRDIEKSSTYPQASKDEHQRLLVGAAVGTGQDINKRVEALIEAHVDVLVVDTAHGHSQGVINKVRWIKTHYPHTQVIAGNIATQEAALALQEAGADAVKVGIGPGSICTTRIIAGIGVPQVTAILDVVQALKDSPVKVIADGGMRFSGDIAKALACGADAVMMGSIFAGTDEAPGEIEYYQGRAYKSYRGMGSLGAMREQHGSSDRYFQAEIEADKYVPEGIEGRVPYKGAISPIIHQLAGGLRSSMGYCGAKDLRTFKKNAKFMTVTHAGMTESHIHDVSITKQAPNYRI